ncbi:phosphotransferase [Actinomadura soli]|uniref:phosphotransferase n=1 Tax=Actinomadura soli TaxID=2508997 RepID=UPI0014861D5F|nr:phosphotransferase [Actinomadura soli]
MAARLHTEGRGSVFLKGIPANDHAVRPYRRERAANLALAPSVPAPRMLWSGECGGWVLLVFEFIDGARSADLSPASPDLPGVLDALSRLGGTGGALPSVTMNLEMLQERATALLAKKLDGPQWGVYAEAIAALSVESLTGEILLHYDLHAGNLLTASQETARGFRAKAARAGRTWVTHRAR